MTTTAQVLKVRFPLGDCVKAEVRVIAQLSSTDSALSKLAAELTALVDYCASSGKVLSLSRISHLMSKHFAGVCGAVTRSGGVVYQGKKNGDCVSVWAEPLD